MKGWIEAVRSAAPIAGVFVLWELLVRLGGVPPYILPAPTTIMADLARNWAVVLPAALYTLQSMLLGFALAVVLGVAIALLLAFSHTLERIIYPLLVLLQIIPKIAVAPLFIIWFGFGLTPKVLLVFLLSFFPVVVNSIVAFKSLDTDVLDLARSTGASWPRIFRLVQLPHALPSLFAGFKVAAALSATAAVVAEFVASDRGLGFLLLQYNGELNTSMTFATVIVLSAMGLGLYAIIEWIERLTIPWHVSQRRDELSFGAQTN